MRKSVNDAMINGSVHTNASVAHILALRLVEPHAARGLVRDVRQGLANLSRLQADVTRWNELRIETRIAVSFGRTIVHLIQRALPEIELAHYLFRQQSVEHLELGEMDVDIRVVLPRRLADEVALVSEAPFRLEEALELLDNL